jgi:hypothetical protein
MSVNWVCESVCSIRKRCLKLVGECDKFEQENHSLIPVVENRQFIKS